MEVHQLRYFVALVEEGNFSRAAERVHVAQPSLSQQIQKLEREIGQPLFDRLKRKVALTEAGAGLLPFARRVLNELADAQKFVSDTQAEPAGIVRVGLIATIAPYILGDLLAASAKKLPHVDVQIIEDVTENLVRAVDDGVIDIAIISTCKPNGAMHLETCATEPLLLALPRNHRLAGQTDIAWTQLRGETVLILHESHCLSSQIRTSCAQRNVKFNNETNALQLGTLLALVASGRGISFIPTMAAGKEKADGCILAPIRSKPPEREINLLRNSSRYQTRAISGFSAVTRNLLCAKFPKSNVHKVP